MKRRVIYAILTIIIACFVYYQELTDTSKNINLDKDGVVDTVKPSFDFLPTSTTKQLVRHRYYTLSYSENNEQAEWVAYELHPNQLQRIDRKRPYFIRDKKVKTKSADYRNYKKSGYDKGHLCPAGDRRFSKNAFEETFLTSNISPQNHQFNAGIWNRLEQKTRYWTKKYGTLYVVTGGILTDKNLKTIGREKVTVPKRFYKIILDYNQPEIKAIAFLIQAKDSNKPLYKFVTSIDKIEQITGIDFFYQLPDTIENKLEATSDYKKWSFR